MDGELGGGSTINLQQMKKIEAVILSSNLNAVRKELERRGIRSGLTVIDVSARRQRKEIAAN